MPAERPARAPMFGAFVLDEAEGCLWRGGERLALTRKQLALLQHLLGQAGRLVPAAELLRAVWGDATVDAGVLKVTMRRLRRTLGDDATRPRFIENVHGRGYRFLRPAAAEADAALVPGPEAPGLVIGRERELAWLVRRLDAALGGTRQVAFVAGEPGIGKTTLLETFAASVARAVPDGRVAWGRCTQPRTTGEPYRAVLDALGRLCRGPDGAQVIETLGRHAPTWLLQLPGAAPPERLASLRQRVAASATRMLRECAEALDALAATAPVVLCLEDLHWADLSTLELLAALAARREPARLLVLTTYRPVEPAHPLAELLRELRLHAPGSALELGPLDEGAVGDYLARRFGWAAVEEPVRAAIYARTAGNPLYLVHLVEALCRHGRLARADGGWQLRGTPEAIAAVVPETVGAVIGEQVDALRPEARRLLEAASFARGAFSAAALAAALAGGIVETDHACAELARRRQFLRAEGMVEWPDGTVAGAYDFAHPLYRDVLRAGVPPAVAAALHARLGARLEAAFGRQAGAIAVDLAEHWEGARDFARATEYRRAAAGTAVGRAAYREAAEHLARGVALWQRARSAPDHRATELRLRIGLANLLQRQHGPLAPEVEAAYRRVRLLARRTPAGEVPFRVPLGLFDHHMARGELEAMRPLARRLWTAARRSRRWDQRLVAHNMGALVAFWSGELRTARTQFRRALTLARAPGAPGPRAAFDIDAATVGANLALVLWTLGDIEEASRREREALVLVRAARNPRTIGWPLGAACFRAGLAHEGQALERLAQEMREAARGFELEIWAAPAERFHRWALVLDGRLDEAVAELRPETAAVLVTNLWQPLVWNALAEQCAGAGRVADAWAALDAVGRLLRRHGTRVALAEWHRSRAAVLLASGGHAAAGEAARSLRRALAVARRQGAVMFELRAARDLLWLRDDPAARRALAAALRRLPARARSPEIDAARAHTSAVAPEPRGRLEWAHGSIPPSLRPDRRHRAAPRRCPKPPAGREGRGRRESS